MNRSPISNSKSDLPHQVTRLTAVIMAHGLAATAAKGQISTGSIVISEASHNTVDLPEMTVESDYQQQLSNPKFTVPLRDLPQTITVIPQKVIEDQGATSLRDILRNSPGITFQAGEGGTPAGDQMTIRGFSARTDMYVDGVRDLGGYARDSFNLEQVEVAKGPSSAIAGRGSTGGSVNLVTKSPYAGRFRNGTASIGTDDYYRATVDANQPVTEDGQTALRFNAMWQDAGVPGRDFVNRKSWGVAPSLAFGLGTPTQVVASFTHMEQDNLPDYGIPRQTLDYDPPVPFSNFYGLVERDFEHIDQNVATLNVSHHTNGELTIRNLTRFGRTHRDSVITAPRFVSGSTETIRRSDWKSRDQTDEIFANQTNVTTRISAGGVDHNLSAGLEFSRESERNHNRVEVPNTVLPDTSVYDPNPHGSYDGNITRDGARVDGRGDTVALYVFDTLRFGERWQVTGGLRFDDFEASQTDVTAEGERTRFSRRDREVSSRIGVVYKPAANASIYAGYADSFNPSAEGLSLVSRNTDLSTVDPEKSRTFEMGAKWDSFRSQLSLGVGIFRSEKTNARTPGVDPNDPPLVLDGKHRVDGIEFSAAGQLTREWEVFAGLTLMNSEIEASNTEGEAGNDLGLVPETSFNLWTTYRLPLGITMGGGIQYMDQVFRNSTSGETVPSYLLVNAMASYAVNEHITLRINANNLTDEDYIDRVGGGHHIPGHSRQLILSTNVSF